MKEKETQNNLAIRAWVYFCFNYVIPEEFIEYICEKVGRPDLQKHFLEKFSEIYDRHGSRAAMNVFYCALSPAYQFALSEFAVKVYAPRGLYLTDDDKASLGI